MKYRIWSHCVDAWWQPNGAGYTTDVAEAGIYDDDKARAIHGRMHIDGCSCRREALSDERIPAPDHSPRPGRQRQGKQYEYQGYGYTLRELHELAKRNGVDISINALWHRLELAEWPIEAAVTTPRSDGRAKAEEASR